ncbi:hypothetical protein V6B14_22845 (plasmid) [Sporosarcina psychrophila]|uniref:hypothetical protein n=1 Tax=Sporosarcina psychrophila TaxID=1476 RepID=UPI0030CEDE29
MVTIIANAVLNLAGNVQMYAYKRWPRIFKENIIINEVVPRNEKLFPGITSLLSMGYTGYNSDFGQKS